ncbi:MAG: type II toxin-antitoxin system HicB family antitoxin [Desulfurococcales archaeon]|nr:type II toxin-antitoxin system HicB family antitoxin [Desulfurococcales archaeon]
MEKKIHEFSVVILEDESGGYVAIVPELPGCHTQGDSLDEVVRNVREAIELYLETLSEEEKKELLNRRVVGFQRVRAIA